VQTDNSYLEDKVALRARHLPDGKVSVLYCFAGTGKIWKAVISSRTDVDIKVLGIEKQVGKAKGFHIPIDNNRFLKSGDLSQFNVIDLDAYGIPYEQIGTILRRRWHGVIFATVIQSIFGRLQNDLLEEVGYSKSMIEKAPVLCCKGGFDKFCSWLASRGIRKVIARRSEDGMKNYIQFTV
jgi:hypothetical protein